MAVPRWRALRPICRARWPQACFDAPEVLPPRLFRNSRPPTRPNLGRGRGSRPGVNFITAEAETTRPSPRDLSRTGHVCRSDADVDFVGWAPSGDYSRDLGALRARIVDGAGSVDEAAVRRLHERTCTMDSGAEARRTLSSARRTVPNHASWVCLQTLLMAGTCHLDHCPIKAGCLGAIALWSALAAGTLSDRNAAETYFSRNSAADPTLGAQTGYRTQSCCHVSGRGQSGTAADLLELAPAQAERSEDVVQLRSDIAAVTANAEAARTEILTAIADGTRTGAGTMIRLIDATIESGQPVEAG